MARYDVSRQDESKHCAQDKEIVLCYTETIISALPRKKCYMISNPSTTILLQAGVPHYEDFVNKAAKLHSHLK